MRRIFPREWERFVEPVPMGERGGNLAAAYARLLAHPDAAVRENAALRWCEWEDTHVSLAPGWTPSRRYQDPEFRMVFARLVTHYWGNDHFLVENQLIDGMERLAEVPAILVHGRYDVSGPLDTAVAISRRWERSRLVVVEDAGHGGSSLIGELVAAINSYAGTRPRPASQRSRGQSEGSVHGSRVVTSSTTATSGGAATRTGGPQAPVP